MSVGNRKDQYRAAADDLNVPMDQAKILVDFSILHDRSPVGCEPKLVQAELVENEGFYSIMACYLSLTPFYETIEKLCKHIRYHHDNYTFLSNLPNKSDGLKNEHIITLANKVMQPLWATPEEQRFNEDMKVESFFL